MSDQLCAALNDKGCEKGCVREDTQNNAAQRATNNGANGEAAADVCVRAAVVREGCTRQSNQGQEGQRFRERGQRVECEGIEALACCFRLFFCCSTTCCCDDHMKGTGTREDWLKALVAFPQHGRDCSNGCMPCAKVAPSTFIHCLLATFSYLPVLFGGFRSCCPENEADSLKHNVVRSQGSEMWPLRHFSNLR